MRSTFFCIAALLFLSLVVACDFKPANRHQSIGWERLDSETDSIIGVLERSYIKATTLAYRDSVTGLLRSFDSGVGVAQIDYWKARLELGKKNFYAADSFVTEGMAAIDSASYPYQWARLLSIRAALPHLPPLDIYRISAANLEYFESVADSVMIASTLMRLGSVMWSINDTVPAARYYLRADTIFSRSGPEEFRVRNLVNIANVQKSPGGIKCRDSIMAYLRECETAQADSALYFVILRNSFLNTSDFSFLRMAYGYIPHDVAGSVTKAECEGAMADYFLGNDFPDDSVRKYAILAYSQIDRISDLYARATVFNAMAYTAYTAGDFDGSLNYYREFVNARISLERERFSLETAKADYRTEFDREQQAVRLRHQREVDVLVFAIILVLALAAAVWVIFYFRVQKAKMRRQAAEVGLQQSRNHLSACALAIEQKDKLLNAIVESVDRLHQSGRVGPAEARELTANVKRSLSSRLDKEAFTELHKKLHPEFMSRLKKDYPMLTESQLRHAAYIAMGLTSKQISDILGIEYDSVKKGRTRLRARMGLRADVSLEDTLRTYSLPEV